ncbi:MAG: Cytochrome biosis protein [Acidobacteria bacterium]|nr:Cytochrome biosis protein [Acidobacteriota bacterium]
MKRFSLLFMISVCVCTLVCAQVARSPAEEELDNRVRDLSQQLRCLVCQNETLADSQADLASDLKRQIREQMKAGKSDKEILAFLTERYGDFVLYRPPVKRTTYLLWFGPFILLGGGLFALFRYIKSRREQIHEQPLSSEEHRRALELLNADSGKESA